MSASDRPVRDAEGLSFWRFFCDCFVPLQKLSLPVKRQHREICDSLQNAVMGTAKKADGTPYQYFVVNMPPRIGKTKILEALALWQMAYFPDSQIIFTGYSSILVERSIRYIGGVLQASWFQELFPTKLGDVLRADQITTADGGTIYGAGVGASITGFGAGLKRAAGGFIAIDDPAKPDEALSETEADNVRQWLETTLKSRRNSDQFCPIIICAQRLAPDDLVGYVCDTYGADVLKITFPAIVEGVYQFAETVGPATLEPLKATRYGRFVLASQYQQEPIALGGNLIPIEAIQRYDAHSPPRFTRIIMTCDTALTAKQGNDYSVLQCWGECERRAYLIDQSRGLWESPELLANAMAFWEKHARREFGDERPAVSEFTVEEKAAGHGLVQQLQKLGIPVKGIERTKDKVTRAQEILPYVETGMVFLPKDGQFPWIAGLLAELASFKKDGTHKHDDQADTLFDGVFRLLGRGISILDVLGARRPGER